MPGEEDHALAVVVALLVVIYLVAVAVGRGARGRVRLADYVFFGGFGGYL